jgi:hypothetical protein
MLQERYERIFQHSSLLLPSQARSLPRLRSCTSLNPTQKSPLRRSQYSRM